MGILPPDRRSLESLAQVHTMDTSLGREDAAILEKAGPVRSLRMNDFSKLQKELLAGKVIEPVNHVQVVGPAPLAPVRPVVQGFFLEVFQLIPEIAEQAIRDAGIAGGAVILPQDFEGHHLGPPVVGLASLETVNEGMVLSRPQIPVGLLGRKDGFHPDPGLGDKAPVLKQISQGQEAIYPVGAPLPCIAVSTQPCVVLPHHLGIDLIQVTGKAIGLPLQLLLQPPPGLNGAQGQFRIAASGKRSPVERLCLQGFRHKKTKQGEMDYYSLHRMVQRVKGTSARISAEEQPNRAWNSPGSATQAWEAASKKLRSSRVKVNWRLRVSPG